MSILSELPARRVRIAAVAVVALLAATTLVGTSFGQPLLRRGLAIVGFAAAVQGPPPSTPPVAPAADRVVPVFFSILGPDSDELHLQPGTHRMMIRASMGDFTSELTFSLTRLDTGEQLATPLVRSRKAEFFEVTFAPGEYQLVEASFPDQPVRITVSPH
jgi:hypothetical protein